MRVIFLTHNYPRFDGDLPGAFLRPLARAVAARGYQVQVVAPSDSGAGGQDELDGIPIQRVRYASADRETIAYSGRMREAIRTPGGILALYGLWRALRHAARSAARQRSTVLHAHWWIPAGLAIPSNARSVLTIHGTDGMLLGRSATARLAGRHVIRRSQKVTAVSGALASRVRDTTGRNDVTVQPMPVDTNGWEWTRGGRGALIVGRLTSQKRVDLALRALARLQGQGRSIRCTVIGDGPERPRLEALAASLNLDDTTFEGSQRPNEVVSHLHEADLAIHPSRDEGFGLAAAEALMTGVPVVCCSDGGGLLDLVPTDGAGRVASPTPESLAGAIGDLFDDPRARDRARERGMEWRKRLDPEAVAERFCRWYDEVGRG